MTESANRQPEITPARPEVPPGSLISVTVARISNPEQLQNFMGQLRNVMAQLTSEPEGILSYKFFTAPGVDEGVRNYYTVTVWRGVEDMQRFRDSGAHGSAKSLDRSHTGDIGYASWVSEGNDLPNSVEEIEERIASTPTD